MNARCGLFITGFRVTGHTDSSSGSIKLKMCRKVELFDKRMVLGVIVP